MDQLEKVGKKLLGSQRIKFSMGFSTDFLQLGMFPLWIQNLLSGTDLILRHFLTDLHSLFKKLHNLVINLIYLLSAFLQICHTVSSQFLFFHPVLLS